MGLSKAIIPSISINWFVEGHHHICMYHGISAFIDVLHFVCSMGYLHLPVCLLCGSHGLIAILFNCYRCLILTK